MPSAWDDRERVRWHYGERYCERELYFDRMIEMFKLNRGYKELRERLQFERVNYRKYYGYTVVVNDDYFDETTVDAVSYTHLDVYKRQPER